MSKLRVIELFAGYGSQHNALKRLKCDYPQFDFDVVAYCEIDKYAIRAYHALHGDTIPNLGDITKVNSSEVPDCDLITWSYPCTDISHAGLQHGFVDGSGTQSSLCWHAVRIIERIRPKYLIMENVAALLSKKFIGDFRQLQAAILNLGYSNYTQIINSKHYGVPQNRPRTFMVSIHHDNRTYYFPQPIPLTRCLKDILEPSAPDGYYLTQDRLAGLLLSNCKEKEAGRGYAFSPKTADSTTANTVTTKAGSRKTDTYVAESCYPSNILQVAQLHPTAHFTNPQRGRVYSPIGIAPTVVTGTGGGLIAKIIEQANTAHPSRGIIMYNNQPSWVRRLTERELFRLMDVDDHDIDKLMASGISNTQLVKLAGNSIVTACLYHIFKKLLLDPAPSNQTRLF